MRILNFTLTTFIVFAFLSFYVSPLHAQKKVSQAKIKTTNSNENASSTYVFSTTNVGQQQKKLEKNVETVLSRSNLVKGEISSKGQIWSDNFETDKGWTLDAGGWERNNAVSEPATDHTTGSGNILANPLGSDYPSGMSREDATSPIIDCSSYTTVNVSFWSFSGCENDSWDHLGFEVYDGSSWQTVLTNGGTSFQETEWNKYAFDVSTYAAGNANFQIRFYMGDTDGSVTYSGWAIDDIEVYEPNNTTSVVDAPTSGQISAGDISSTKTISADAVSVFRFDVTDLASGDALPTQVTTFNIHKNGGTADWTDNIGGAELWNGGTKIANLDVTITDTDISFTKSTGTFDVADGTSEEITMKIWLNNSNIADNSTLIFEVSQTGHGFVASVAGSTFDTDFGTATVSNTQTIRVVATQLLFTGQPASVATSGVALTTQPIVSATDENGNVDVDITSSVTLDNTGSLGMNNNSMNFVAGVADFGIPNNFQFTSGGAYVMLTATAPGLSTQSPSTEIAVDIVGCTIWSEDFVDHSATSDLPSTGNGSSGGHSYTWDQYQITNSKNDWGIGDIGSSNSCLTIYRGTTAFSYDKTNASAEVIAYCTTPIDATNYKNLSIDFNWQCDGEDDVDFGTIVWSTDGTNWSIAEPTHYQDQETFMSATGVDISVCDGQQFYIGFRWINDGSGGSPPPFAVDDIVIKGFPKFDYNFSYRQDDFEQITGTVLTNFSNDGENITLPSGFAFSYDGTPVTAIRANLNGWLEMGTSHTANAETNELSSSSRVPFLAPLWDDLTSDGQTRIIYLVEGVSPTRTFTVEWKDVLWGSQRQNFQVKLYETSNVIEFWYGDMNTNSGGSASIGINNAGGCMNKLISVIPGTTPTASYTAENSTINSATYLTEGLVYIFNPLEMQSYNSWEEATVCIGQSDFTQRDVTWHQWTTPGANSTAVSSKGVLAVGAQQDPGPWDNTWGWTTPKDVGRVLIWNSMPTSDGVNADAVIGKTSFTDETTGCTAVLMTDCEGVAFTPDGEKLIVSDGNNNRVLIWNTIPTGAGQAADVVIGQPDFTSGGSGCSATQMYYPTDIFVTPDGKLFICDYMNNRVLIYNSVPTTNNVAADVVIGQSNFTSNTANTSASGLSGPWGVGYSPDAKLLIADAVNNRVLIYNDVPTTNGASANIVIGQNDFTSSANGVDKNRVYAPIGVTVSPEGKVALGDFQNSRVLIYNRIPSNNGADADVVLGQSNFKEGYSYSDGLSQQDNAYSNPYLPTNKNMFTVYGVTFDLNGRLLTSAKYMQRAMLYGETPTETADLEVNIISNETDVCIYSDIEYSVEITNNGGDDAYSVVVNAQLPVGMNLNKYDASIGTYNGKSGYWMIPFIANGETVTLTFEGEVQPDLGGKNVTAYANIIASKQADSDFSNNGDNQIVAIRTYYAPTSTDIADQYINRNSHTIPVVSFTVDDQDGLPDISSYTCNSSNTTLVPINYSANLLFAGSAPDKELDIYPATDEYGYSDMTLILTDSHGCHKNYDFTVIVGNIWEGEDILAPGSNTDWFVANNWSSGVVPTKTIEAIIPTTPIGGYFPIIDAAGAKCSDLIIEPRASVTLEDTRDLTIYNDFYIQSDATGTGSLVDQNTAGFNQVTIVGDIFIDRFITPDAWHYVSSPLTGATNKVLTEDVCGVNYNGNVLDFNEAYSTDYDGDGDIDWFDGWEWPWYYTHNYDELVAANGYAYYTFASMCSHNVQFTGSSVNLNTGNFSYTVTNQDKDDLSSGNPHRGWNLIGNPYPSGLNANSFLTNNTATIDETIYFWDESGFVGFDLEGADYAAYNPSLGATTGQGSGAVIPDNYISCGQAFFVHRTATDASGTNISFNNSMRETENSFFFKKDTAKVEIPKVKLSVTNSSNMYNELVVGLVEDATYGIDSKYDGYKIEGNPELSFYSIIENQNFTFQGIPIIRGRELKSIPLGLNAGIVGNYTFEIRLIEYMPDTIGVYLEDKEQNIIIDLKKTPSYSVNIDEIGRYNDRFVLHFNFNHAPYLVNPVKDKTVYAGQNFGFTIGSNTFNDIDPNDELTYSVQMSDGNNIPNWIIFTEENLSFYLSPTEAQVGDYSLKVKATDKFGSTAFDDFIITVKSTSNISLIDNVEFTIYPNPTNGIFNITTSKQDPYKFNVTDVVGRTILERTCNNEEEQVNLETYSSGIYFITISYNNKFTTYKIILDN